MTDPCPSRDPIQDVACLLTDTHAAHLTGQHFTFMREGRETVQWGVSRADKDRWLAAENADPWLGWQDAGFTSADPEVFTR